MNWITPIFKTPSHDDSEKRSVVFHRDDAGTVVAEFHGPNHRRDANKFCQMFGEESRWRKEGQDGD